MNYKGKPKNQMNMNVQSQKKLKKTLRYGKELKR